MSFDRVSEIVGVLDEKYVWKSSRSHKLPQKIVQLSQAWKSHKIGLSKIKMRIRKLSKLCDISHKYHMDRYHMDVVSSLAC